MVIPTQLALPVANFLQVLEGEPNHILRRIHQMMEVQQIKEQVMDSTRQRTKGELQEHVLR